MIKMNWISPDSQKGLLLSVRIKPKLIKTDDSREFPNKRRPTEATPQYTAVVNVRPMTDPF